MNNDNDFIKTIEQIENMSNKKKQEVIKNINKVYLNQFKNNLSYWISISDLLDAVNEDVSHYVTMNKNVKEIYDKIKKSKLKVVLV